MTSTRTCIPARLEPTVEDLLDSSQDALALLRGNGDVIDLVAVEVGYTLHPRQRLELLHGPYADNLAAANE